MKNIIKSSRLKKTTDLHKRTAKPSKRFANFLYKKCRTINSGIMFVGAEWAIYGYQYLGAAYRLIPESRNPEINLCAVKVKTNFCEIQNNFKSLSMDAFNHDEYKKIKKNMSNVEKKVLIDNFNTMCEDNNFYNELSSPELNSMFDVFQYGWICRDMAG